MGIKRARILNDIRYFESSALPSAEEPMPYYMGKLFACPPASVAFGQLIGGKCAELKLSINGGSALYLLFTPALPDGELQRLVYTTEVWQTWVACGLPESFNALGLEAQAARVREATFRALRFLAPDFESAVSEIADQYQRHGGLLRVRCAEKTTRGYRLIVACEVLPFREVSHLWLEVTDTRTGRRAEVRVTPLKMWDHGPFLAQSVVIAGAEIVIRPRTSAAAAYYTKGYAAPFRIRIDSLFPPDGK